MEMLKKFLKEVIVVVVGKQAEEIADLLDSNKHVNEFTIAKKLEITINQTRNILYKIADKGLVSSIRKKDKKKGWYTYFWKIEILKSLEFLKENLLKGINHFNNQIKSRETKDFYHCERCNIEVSEENALAYDFTCNECGSVFVLKDNSKILKELKRNLGKLEREFDLVNKEIGVETEKLEKKKVKEIRKIEKEKKAKAAANRKARKKLALKVKKVKKKPVKKKLSKNKKTLRKKISKKKPVKKKLSKNKKTLRKKTSKKKTSKKKSLKKKHVKKKVRKSKKPLKKKIIKKKRK